MSKKVSIYDIAKAAGVSAAAVSYVINGKKKVSAKTEKRILHEMEVMGYTPDHVAVSLSTGKSMLIGLCLPLNDAGSFPDNPFYSEFLGAFIEVASKNGYDVVLGGIRSERDFTKWVNSRRFDGIAFFGLFPKRIEEIVRKMGAPIVLIDIDNEQNKGLSSVCVDDEVGTYRATEYLISQGHRRIGFVGGIRTSSINMKRYSGFEKAMHSHGLTPETKFVFETETGRQGGMIVAEKLATMLPDVTAVVCDADIIAIGIIQRLQELGHAIPQEISIVGFDDINASSFIYPALTTVNQSIAEKGQKAAELMLRSLSNKNTLAETVVIEPKLVVRNTVKNLNEA